MAWPANWGAKYFAPTELTVTGTGLTNLPSAAEWSNLEQLATQVLDPFRVTVGPIRITSGYRSAAVNTAIGGSKSSMHLVGKAADFKLASGTKSSAVFPILAAMARNLPVRQLILYAPERGGHIHVDYSPGSSLQLIYAPAGGGYEAWSGQE